MTADNSRLVWLDLCSGLGGASQPALDRGWHVIRVDIDPRFKPDIVADVRALPLHPFHIDVLWASPPCQEFSKWGFRCFYPNPPQPDLSIVSSIFTMINQWPCDFWIVENVWAARQFLSPIFGPVACLNPGHAFWGRLPGLLPDTKAHKGTVGDRARLKGRSYRPGQRHGVINGGAHARSFVKHLKDAPAEAAKIPYEIGEAICRAVEGRR